MELQQWKQNFIRDYLDEIDSLEVMDKLEKYTKRILNKKPVALSPIAFNIDETNVQVEPFPFVPATCINFNFFCGFPNISSKNFIRSKPGLIPNCKKELT